VTLFRAGLVSRTLVSDAIGPSGAGKVALPFYMARRVTDNGSPYVVGEIRRFARHIGLVPRANQVSSPQFIRMAEAFIRTLKRNCIRVNPMPDARTVIEQPPAWLDHRNEVHPYKASGYRSPHKYIMQTREAPSGIQEGRTQ
jgi:putative transposase